MPEEHLALGAQDMILSSSFQVIGGLDSCFGGTKAVISDLPSTRTRGSNLQTTSSSHQLRVS